LRDRCLWLLESRLHDRQPLHHQLGDLLDRLADKRSALTGRALNYEIDWFCLAATDNTQGSVERRNRQILWIAGEGMITRRPW
jgi:hypothetical protein